MLFRIQFIWLQQRLFNSLLQWTSVSFCCITFLKIWTNADPNFITFGSFSINLQSYLWEKHQATLMVQRTLWRPQVSRWTLVASTWLSQWSHKVHSSDHSLWVETPSDHAVESWMMLEVEPWNLYYKFTYPMVDLLSFGKPSWKISNCGFVTGDLFHLPPKYVQFLSRPHTAPHTIIFPGFECSWWKFDSHKASHAMRTSTLCYLPSPPCGHLGCGHVEKPKWDLWLLLTLTFKKNPPGTGDPVVHSMVSLASGWPPIIFQQLLRCPTLTSLGGQNSPASFGNYKGAAAQGFFWHADLPGM